MAPGLSYAIAAQLAYPDRQSVAIVGDGGLTPNVLLSFAQFEREVAGERIRDKFAASRRKGMWMGGTVALGYDVKGRKLVINETEAETVRLIFRCYLAVGW